MLELAVVTISALLPQCGSAGGDWSTGLENVTAAVASGDDAADFINDQQRYTHAHRPHNIPYKHNHGV